MGRKPLPGLSAPWGQQGRDRRLFIIMHVFGGRGEGRTVVKGWGARRLHEEEAIGKAGGDGARVCIRKT